MNCYDHHEIMINSGIMMIMKQPPFPGMYRTKHFVDLHLLKIRYKDIVGNDVFSIEGFIKYLKEIAKERSENDAESEDKDMLDSESEDKAHVLSLSLKSDLLTLNRSLSIPFITDRTVDGAISQNGRLVTNSIGDILLPTQAFLQCLKSISKRKAEQGDNRNQEKVVSLWNGQFDCQSLRQSVPHRSWISELRWPTDSRLGPAVRKKMAMEYEEFHDDFTWEEIKSFSSNHKLPLTPRIGLVC
jgi:hypothetical protein